MPGTSGMRGSTPVATTTSSKSVRSVDLRAPAEVHRDASEVEAPAVVADRLGEVLLAGDALGDRELAAEVVARLEELDPVASLGERDRGREAGRARARRPRRAWCGGSGARTSSVSWAARGLTRQVAVFLEKVWSRQAWLQAMHVLISSARPPAALTTQSGSASSGRAIDTRSALPSATTCSARSGIVIRFEVTTGIESSGRSCAVTRVKAPRGTEVTIVGTRASCQPMPVLMIVAPAASTSRASATISSHDCPSGTRSSMERR